MRAVADVFDDSQRAVTHDPVHIVSDRAWGNQVVAALKQQDGTVDTTQIVAMIRKESNARKVRGNLGIGAAETVRQLFAKFGLVWCAQ